MRNFGFTSDSSKFSGVYEGDPNREIVKNIVCDWYLNHDRWGTPLLTKDQVDSLLSLL